MFFQIEIHEPAAGAFRAVLLRCEPTGERVLHQTEDHPTLEDAEGECRDVLTAMYGPVNRSAA